MLVENPRYHLGSDGGSSRMDASTEATSGLACRGGMTAACSKNAKTAALQGVRRAQSCQEYGAIPDYGVSGICPTLEGL